MLTWEGWGEPLFCLGVGRPQLGEVGAAEEVVSRECRRHRAGATSRLFRAVTFKSRLQPPLQYSASFRFEHYLEVFPPVWGRADFGLECRDVQPVFLWYELGKGSLPFNDEFWVTEDPLTGLAHEVFSEESS